MLKKDMILDLQQYFFDYSNFIEDEFKRIINDDK